MSTIMQVELSLSVIISLIAISLSTYSILSSKKRNEHLDVRELTKSITNINTRVETLEDNSPAIKTLGATLATINTKMETIENAVLSKPTLSEQVVRHEQRLIDLERRIAIMEQNNFKE